jgi:hypothetical protein
VTLALPLFPSLVAVIVAVPVATPCTTPFDETVATAVLALTQVTVRPLRTLFAESRSVTCNATDWPVEMFELPGLTVTDATGAEAATMIVIFAVPRVP